MTKTTASVVSIAAVAILGGFLLIEETPTVDPLIPLAVEVDTNTPPETNFVEQAWLWQLNQTNIPEDTNVTVITAVAYLPDETWELTTNTP